MSNRSEGELQQLVVFFAITDEYFIYFPDNSNAIIDLSVLNKKAEKVILQRYNPKSGDYTKKSAVKILEKEIK